MTEKKTHGGARPGSGRKATGRVASNPVLVFLDDDDRGKLDALIATRKKKQTEVVRELIRDAYDSKK